MNLIKHLPNAITCLNLFSGSAGVWLGFQGNYTGAMVAILLSGIFDFLDGFVARLTHSYSEMGKELDSLADVVSFGLVPASIVFSMLAESNSFASYKFLAFSISVFSALRLAKFNIDERQTTSFIGLPTPANAFFWGGLAVSFSDWFIQNPIILIVLTFVFSLLLVAEFPMFSLKFKSLKWKDNKVKFLFLLVNIILIILLKEKSISFIIIWYIILSAINFIFNKKTSQENS